MNYFGIVKAALSGGIKGHFGQWAEDALVRKLFPSSLRRGVYMDIGAYHPLVREMKNRGYTPMGRAGPTSIFLRTAS